MNGGEGAKFDALVEDFGLAAGMTFERDADGLWRIPAHGGEVTAYLAYREASGQVVVFAPVEKLRPRRHAAERARALLEANAFWDGTNGFTLALDPDERLLVAMDRRAPGYFSSVGRLAGYVNALAELVVELRFNLRHFDEAAEIAEELERKEN